MLGNNAVRALVFCLLQVASCDDEPCETSVIEKGKPATVTAYFTSSVTAGIEAIVVSNRDYKSGKTVLDCLRESIGFMCYPAPGYTREGISPNSLTMKISSFTEEHAGTYVFQTMPPLPGGPVTCTLELKGDDEPCETSVIEKGKPATVTAYFTSSVTAGIEAIVVSNRDYKSDEKTETASEIHLVVPLIISVVLNAVLVSVGAVLVRRYCRYKYGTKAAAPTMAFKDAAQQTDAHEDFETLQTLLKEAQQKQRQTRYWFPKWHSESRLNTVKETNLAAAITLLDQDSDAEVSLLTTEYTEMETLEDPVNVSDQTKQPMQEETPIDGGETSNYGNDHDVMRCTRSGDLVDSKREKPLETVEESDRETASPRTRRAQRDQKMTQMKIPFSSADPQNINCSTNTNRAPSLQNNTNHSLVT